MLQLGMAALAGLRGFFGDVRDDANAYLDSFDAAAAVDEDEPEDIPTLVVRKATDTEPAFVVSAVELYERGYRDFAEINCGSFACVYSALAPNNSRVAIKLGFVFADEVDAQRRAASFGIAPAILDEFEVDIGTRNAATNTFDLFDSEPTYALVMPLMLTLGVYMDETGLSASLLRAFEHLVALKARHSVFHGDVHPGNIVLRVDPGNTAVVLEMQLIDWGFASVYRKLDSDAKRSAALTADCVLWMAKFVQNSVQLGVVGELIETAARLGDDEDSDVDSSYVEQLRSKTLDYTKSLVMSTLGVQWNMPPQVIPREGFAETLQWPQTDKLRKKLIERYDYALRAGDDDDNVEEYFISIDDAKIREFAQRDYGQ